MTRERKDFNRTPGPLRRFSTLGTPSECILLNCRWRIAIDAHPNILVVLSDDLLCHLRRVAKEEQIPLRWLVAGLVCDTFDTEVERSVERQVARTRS